jgi:hypothetical protein
MQTKTCAPNSPDFSFFSYSFLSPGHSCVTRRDHYPPWEFSASPSCFSLPLRELQIRESPCGLELTCHSVYRFCYKDNSSAQVKRYRKPTGCWWLKPIILAIWEAEIRRMMDQSQSGKIVPKTSISKITRAKWTGGVAQVVGVCFASAKP